MTCDFSKFSTFTKNDGEFVTFGDNVKEKIIGIGNVGNSSPSIIENILLVDNLKHNLLSLVNYVIKVIVLFFNSPNAWLRMLVQRRLFLLVIEKIIFAQLTLKNFLFKKNIFRFLKMILGFGIEDLHMLAWVIFQLFQRKILLMVNLVLFSKRTSHGFI